MQFTSALPVMFPFFIPLPNIPLPLFSFCNSPEHHSPVYA
jgi:hypothetical protein